MLGGLIGAAGALLGGALNRNESRSAQHAQQVSSAQDRALQKEFAQHGVRWKVEDAKAAGLHPLYALGGNTASYSPVSNISGGTSGMGDAIQNMGQSLSRSVAAQETQDQRELRQLQKRLTLSQIDEHDARAQMLRSQAAAVAGPEATVFPYGGTSSRAIGSYPLPPKRGLTTGSPDGLVEIKPDQITSPRRGASHMTAGLHSAWKERQVGPGMRMLTPNNDEMEIDAAMLPPMYGTNIREYGPRAFANAYSGGLYEDVQNWLSGIDRYLPWSRQRRIRAGLPVWSYGRR